MALLEIQSKLVLEQGKLTVTKDNTLELLLFFFLTGKKMKAAC